MLVSPNVVQFKNQCDSLHLVFIIATHRCICHIASPPLLSACGCPAGPVRQRLLRRTAAGSSLHALAMDRPCPHALHHRSVLRWLACCRCDCGDRARLLRLQLNRAVLPVWLRLTTRAGLSGMLLHACWARADPGPDCRNRHRPPPARVPRAVLQAAVFMPAAGASGRTGLARPGWQRSPAVSGGEWQVAALAVRRLPAVPCRPPSKLARSSGPMQGSCPQSTLR